MFNYINTIIAVLEKAELITKEGAAKLAGELQGMIHQHSYRDAYTMVDKLASEVESFTSEPWNKHITELEKRVNSLEDALKNKSKADKVK